MDLLDDDDLLNLRRRATSTDPAAVVAEEREGRVSLPNQNRDLDEWASAHPATEPGAGQMRDGTQCHVCGTRAGRSACTNCGRLACSADTWFMLRLCRICAKEERFQHEPKAGEAA